MSVHFSDGAADDPTSAWGRPLLAAHDEGNRAHHGVSDTGESGFFNEAVWGRQRDAASRITGSPTPSRPGRHPDDSVS